MAVSITSQNNIENGVSHQLAGWAALDQSVRTTGPTSGQFISGHLGVTPPFINAQPIPGWSGLLNNQDGTFTALPDNGFGAKSNSADFVIGVYIITPSFKTHGDGSTKPGKIENTTFIRFNDRNGILNNGEGVDLLITADFNNYRSGSGFGSNSAIAVATQITAGRLLTGYDFDVESIARAEDGSYWVGEEFGPFLLHFDSNGTLLEEPVAHPVLVSPYHPSAMAFPGTHSLGASRGFESLAFDHDKQYLYAVPEAVAVIDKLRPVPGDERVVEIYQFDPKTSSYTGLSFKYRKDGNKTANDTVIGDMTNVGLDKYVLIERDSLFGPEAKIKRLYIIDLNETDRQGVLEKRLLVDLLRISDPKDIGGPLPGLTKHQFNMPFDSIECVVVFNKTTLGIAIDTNFPSEDGREPGIPDSTEFIKVRFNKPVASFAPTRDNKPD